MTVIVHFNDPLFKNAINDSQSFLFDNSAQLFCYALERYTACGHSFFRTRLKNSDFQCKNKQESTISDRITTIFAPVMYFLKLDKDI